MMMLRARSNIMGWPKGRRNFKKRIRRSKGLILRLGVMSPILANPFQYGVYHCDIYFTSKKMSDPRFHYG